MSANLTESDLTRLITEYLDNGNIDLPLSVVKTIKNYASTHFYRQDKESLRLAKENFNTRVSSGEYDSGDEMHAPNNFNKGLGPKYNAVNMYYDSSHFMAFINEFSDILKPLVMIVLSSEAFKILCHNDDEDYEEDKKWFIQNLGYIISSIVRK